MGSPKWKHKFDVGDIVYMEDNHHFNPANEVLSVGRIEAIHIYRGRSLAAYRTPTGTFKTKNYKGRVTYTVSGFSLRPEEAQLKLWHPKED